MSIAPSDLATPYIETVPNARIRGLVTLFLRVGLGLHLLNGGLLGYMTMNRAQGGFGFNPALGRWGGQQDPIVEAVKLIPYFEIAAGVALVFGFLTTLASILSLTVILVGPVIQIVYMLINPGQGLQQTGFPVGIEFTLMNSTRGVTLLIGAIVLWLSPTATNPYSIDGLIFNGGTATNPPRTAGATPRSWEPPPLPQAGQAPTDEVEVMPID